MNKVCVAPDFVAQISPPCEGGVRGGPGTNHRPGVLTPNVLAQGTPVTPPNPPFARGGKITLADGSTPLNSDRQAHDEIVPSPREEADEWRECEGDELSARVLLPGAIYVSPCLPSDQAGSDRPGLRLTRQRARFLLCGRLNC